MDDEQQQRAGRPCLVCSNRERGLIEQALISQPLSDIARRFNVGRGALRRHGRRHMSVTMRDAYLAAQGLDQMSLIQEIADVVEQQHLIATEAADKGHAVAASRANDTRLRAIAALLAMRVGSTEEADYIRKASDVIRAAIRIGRENPAFASAFAEAIEDAGNITLLEEYRDAVPAPEEQSLEAAR